MADDAGTNTTGGASGSAGAGGTAATTTEDFVQNGIECTDEERAAIAELRTIVEPDMKKYNVSPWWRADSSLLRFIRARKTMDESVAMYRDVMKWRQEVGADNILNEEEPEVCAKYFPTGFHGYDLDGYPLLFERIGCIDTKGITDAIGVEGFLRWVIRYHERQEQVMQEAGRRAGSVRNSMTVVVDLAGLSMRHLSPSAIRPSQRRTRLEEDHYPEVCRRVFIIRAPSVFNLAYKMMKPFVDEGTRNKIRILGSDYLEELKKYIPEEHLPAFLGGPCKCEGDDNCASRINPGGVVPDRLRAGLSDSAETVNIKSGLAASVEVPTKEGSLLSWNFKVKSHDVDFHAFFTPVLPDPSGSAALKSVQAPGGGDSLSPAAGAGAGAGAGAASGSGADSKPAVEQFREATMSKAVSRPKSAEVIIETTRVSEHTGEYTATKHGVMTFVWDNTFSWTRSKTVMHMIETVEPLVDDAAETDAAKPVEGTSSSSGPPGEPADE